VGATLARINYVYIYILYFREWNHNTILNIPQLWEIREINFPCEKSLNIKKGYIQREIQEPTLFMSSPVSVGV
jgi:hypothetical protein